MSHSYWPRDVKHAEDIVKYTQDRQIAVDMSIQLSWCMFLRYYSRSDSCFFKECRVP